MTIQEVIEWSESRVEELRELRESLLRDAALFSDEELEELLSEIDEVVDLTKVVTSKAICKMSLSRLISDESGGCLHKRDVTGNSTTLKGN